MDDDGFGMLKTPTQSTAVVSISQKDNPLPPAQDRDVLEIVKELYRLRRESKKPLGNMYGNTIDRKTESDYPRTGIVKDIKALFPQNIWESIVTLVDILKQKKRGGYIDDRQFLLERSLRLSSRLPDLSLNRLRLTSSQVDELWDNLRHPPLSYLGNEYSYRMPDGSNNNIMYPQIGKAGTPYAKSVKPMTAQPGALPDAGLLFDTLLARKKFQKHPNEISSMLFYLASIIIHDLFRTSHRDPNISYTSSYLDLSPLYGSNLTEQMTIRTFKNGKIKPDTFCEKRVLGFPPGVSALLVAFNRFHNYVAEQLLAINERGRFDLRYERGEKRRTEEGKRRAALRRDEHLFQTARLVTCGLYVNIILNDYVRTIINLVETDSNWTLDPRYDPQRAWNKDGTPSGIGNQVSVEFNLIYRWHACVSEKDEQWTNEFFQKIFPEKDINKLSLPEFVAGLNRWERRLPSDPEERTFGDLRRKPDGRFDDFELVNLLCDGVDDRAGAFAERNIPIALRMVEILGIEQARTWKCATLNELREFFGLKAYNSFDEVNSNPMIADTLKQLYSHPDYIEMYPGVIIEEAKPTMVPGSGLCPNYTISRAILSDAIALVRGDRFFTVDYTAANLTSWGIAEVASHTNVDNGCVMYKLLTKAFPNHFTYNSIYAHYPFTNPGKMYQIMTKLGRAHLYDYERPSPAPPKTPILSYAAAVRILTDPENFATPWGSRIRLITGEEFMLSGDRPIHREIREFVSNCIYGQDAWEDEVIDFFQTRCYELLKEKSYNMGEFYTVDVVRDVGNVLQAHFAAELLAIPLKTQANPNGVYTEQELFHILSVMMLFIFFDQDNSHGFALRQAAAKAAASLIDVMTLKIKTLKRAGWRPLGKLFLKAPHSGGMDSFGTKLLKRFLESGESAEKIARKYVATVACASCPHQSTVIAQVLDFYLMPENAQHLSEIQHFSQIDTIEAYEIVKKYALEGARLAHTFGCIRKVAAEEITIEDMGRQLTFKKDELLLISFISAGRDPNIFPQPLTVRLDRPQESYIHYSVGPHRCLGRGINMDALAAQLRVFGRLPGLRRAPGPQGQLKFVPKEGGQKAYLEENWSGYSPFPTTMKICFDSLPERL